MTFPIFKALFHFRFLLIFSEVFKVLMVGYGFWSLAYFGYCMAPELDGPDRAPLTLNTGCL